MSSIIRTVGKILFNKNKAGKQIFRGFKKIKDILLGGFDVAFGEIGKFLGIFSSKFRPPEPGWPSIEFHAPGYNFLGPGTNYKLRIARGDKPINFLDACAMRHDGVYSRTNLTIEDIEKADKIFLNCIKLKKGTLSQVLLKFMIQQIFKGKQLLIEKGILDPRLFTGGT